MNIQESIRMLAGANPDAILLCTADEVDTRQRTALCTPLDESAPIHAALMQAATARSEGLLVVPRQRSIVAVALLANRSAGIIVATTEADAVEATVGPHTLRIDQDGVAVNGGKLGGVPVAGKIQEALDSIKQYVDHMHLAIQNGLTSVGAGPAADGPAGSSAYATAMADKKIELPDLEDEHFTH